MTRNTREPGRRQRRRLIVFLPLLLAVIFCASQLSLRWDRQNRLDIEIEPLQTANYGPWERTRFAPVLPQIGTQVAREFVIGGTYVAVAQPPTETLVAQVVSSTPVNAIENTALPTEQATAVEASPAPSTATSTVGLTPSATITETPSATITADGGPDASRSGE